MIYRLTIEGIPQPKERPRFARPTKHRPKGWVYTPQKTQTFETAVYVAAYNAKLPLLTDDVDAVITFYLPDRRTRDFDNLGKSVTDALEGKAWKNDNQLGWGKDGVTIKKRVDKNNPRTELEYWLAKDHSPDNHGPSGQNNREK